MLIDSQRAENHASISLFEKYWRAEELDSLIHTPSDACLCYQANSVSVFFLKATYISENLIRDYKWTVKF